MSSRNKAIVFETQWIKKNLWGVAHSRYMSSKCVQSPATSYFPSFSTDVLGNFKIVEERQSN